MVYTPPLEDLLKWPTPNYENPETRGPEVVIVNSVFLAFATLFIVLRLYTRLFVRKWFGIDDVFILIAYVCSSTDRHTMTLTPVGCHDRVQRNHHRRCCTSWME